MQRMLQIWPKLFGWTLGLVVFLIYLVAVLLCLMENYTTLAERCVSGDTAICDAFLKPHAFIELYLAAKEATALFAKAFVMCAVGLACVKLCWWNVSSKL